MNELLDVKCAECKRVIGQRHGATFYQFGMKTKFNKSARIFCPFIGCGFEQDFLVNRDNAGGLRNIFVDKRFALR